MENLLFVCPFCGHPPGNLMMVKIFCANEKCAIFDLPIDVDKWNRRDAGPAPQPQMLQQAQEELLRQSKEKIEPA